MMFRKNKKFNPSCSKKQPFCCFLLQLPITMIPDKDRYFVGKEVQTNK